MNWLDTIKTLKLPSLQSGSHDSASAGLCAMEMVAFMERLPHSDSPPCTCPVLAAYTRGINDMLPDADRQRLLPYLPRLVGTVSPQHEQARAEYLVQETTHRIVALLFDARWPEHAKALRNAQTMDEIYTAARVAARAADAVAADAAARAARAASAVSAVATGVLSILDGALQIGPSAQQFSDVARAQALAELA